MQKTSCCNNYTCGFCVELMVKQSFRNKLKGKLTCNFCRNTTFEYLPVGREEPVRYYQESPYKHINSSALARTPAGNRSSEKKAGKVTLGQCRDFGLEIPDEVEHLVNIYLPPEDLLDGDEEAITPIQGSGLKQDSVQLTQASMIKKSGIKIDSRTKGLFQEHPSPLGVSSFKIARAREEESESTTAFQVISRGGLLNIIPVEQQVFMKSRKYTRTRYGSALPN